MKTLRGQSDDAAIDALRRELLQSLRDELSAASALRGDRRAMREASALGLQRFRDLLAGRAPPSPGG
jgi:hypothetical protein